MKRILTVLMVLSGILAGASAYAQTEEQPAQQTYKVYCEIISTSRSLFSNKTTVELDFGQYASWWSADRNLVDENGESIQFNSVLDAVNYMAARGGFLSRCTLSRPSPREIPTRPPITGSCPRM